MRRIRVVIADDHPVLRQGICVLLQGHNRIELVGEAATGVEALQLVEELRPDVLILDAEMPGLTGMDVAEQISVPCPILVLSAYGDFGYVKRFLRAGVAGYLLKEDAAWKLIKAIEALARNEKGWYSPQIQSLLYLAEQRDVATELSKRESQVLRHLCNGKTNYAIGQALRISEKTVEKHLESIYRKLNVRSRTEAAVSAVSEKLV